MSTIEHYRTKYNKIVDISNRNTFDNIAPILLLSQA